MELTDRYDRATQKEYLRIFSESLIPTALSGAAKVCFGHPAWGSAEKVARLPDGVSVLGESVPLLQEANHTGSYVRSAAWAEQGFHSSRFTLLLCVLDGDTDFRIGVTKKIANEYALDRRQGQQVWQLPTSSICVVPPNVPFDDGLRPHWLRSEVEKARSTLHWIHLTPVGALIHSCQTSGTQHGMSPYLCIHNSNMVSLGEHLCDSLASDAARAVDITRAHLLALLWSIEQGIVSMHATRVGLIPGREALLENDDRSYSESAAVRRAQQFILAHLQETLTVESIATSAYGSTSWLNRQFKMELGMSIMQYVTQRRISEARLLLADTDLPVSEIGKLIGFPDPSYFSQVFTRWQKVSPHQFRKNLW